MFEPIQIITFRQKSGTTCTPEAPQYAGVQGDTGRTCVDFVLPEDLTADNHLYRMEVVTGGGSVVTSDLLTPAGGIVSLPLTRPFTEAGGRCTVRLIVTEVDENGDQTAECCALAGRIYFEDRPTEGLPVVKHGISEMLLGIAEDCEAAEQSATVASTAATAASYHLQSTEVYAKQALSSAAAAETAAMTTDAAIQRISRQYAPASAVTTEGSPAVLPRCADAFLAGLEITGDTLSSGEPNIDSPVTFTTSMEEDASLIIIGENHEQTVDLTGLRLERWDTLFLDTDGLWKIERATQTDVYGSATTINTTNDINATVSRYLLGNFVFSSPRSLDEGYCSHLPTLRSNLYTPGLLVGFGSGTHINFRLDTALFPDKAAVSAWLTEQETLGTPVTVKYRSSAPTVETLSAEWQETLNAIRTVAGKNTVTVEAAVLPSTIRVSAVAAAPERTDGVLAAGETRVLRSHENFCAYSAGAGLRLTAANGDVLLQDMVFIRITSAAEQNDAFNTIVEYQCKDDRTRYTAITLENGAVLQSTSGDAFFASVC